MDEHQDSNGSYDPSPALDVVLLKICLGSVGLKLASTLDHACVRVTMFGTRAWRTAQTWASYPGHCY